jgi:Na+/H+ antiporter NhaC
MCDKLRTLFVGLLFLGTGAFAQSTAKLIFPEAILSDVNTEVDLVFTSDSIPGVILINGQEVPVVQEEGRAYFIYKFQVSEKLDVSGYAIGSEQPNVVPLWMSILPPLIAILFALIFKEVIFSMISGIFIGGAIMGMYAEGWIGIFTGFLKVIDTYILHSLNDTGHISVIVFSIIIGGVVAIISRNGGMHGIVNIIVKYANNARNGQLATYFLGIAIFFDDYANTLVVGNTMRPITDRLKVSREKLSYIVDATAAPISAIAFVTTWIGAELGYISKGVEGINAAGGEQINEGVYSIFLNSLPYAFYPILTIFFMGYLIWRQRDFGSMLKAERRARKGDVINPEINDADLSELKDLDPVKGIKYRAFNAIIPVAIIVFGTMVGLVYTGFSSLESQLAAADPNLVITGWGDIWTNMPIIDETVNSFTRRLGTLIGASDSYSALLWASLCSLFAAMALTIGQRIMSLQKTMETAISGFKTMIPALLILILAWSLALVTDDMHTADYLTGLMSGNVSPWLIPAFTFVLASVVAFSTGSSWSTMALVYPLIIPATWAICLSPESGMDVATTMPIFYSTVSAVLAGAVLGDHCSPISDTTILSSLASGCNHIDHVRTQMPYALTVGAVSVVFGSLLTGLGLNPWLGMLLGAITCILIVEFVGKRIDDSEVSHKPDSKI